MANKRRIFLESTPLGYHVLLTRDRWREIVKYKHPAMAKRVKEVQMCIADPDIIRASEKNADVHLFYRITTDGTICVVVGGGLPLGRFVVTAYLTRKPKRGA